MEAGSVCRREMRGAAPIVLERVMDRVAWSVSDLGESKRG